MPQIIAALVALLVSAARQYLPGIAGRILLALGIGFVTHEIAMPSLKSLVESKFGALPPVLQAYWGATGIGVAVTMILSAWIAGRAQKAVLSKLGSK
ncbi:MULTISPECIES: DUF2523 family protein [unclassified Stenotrophomonas]|uniref:DUF2523 family protein n=1 Tax=unclassified Stenotrophomonas TaxID=196198 RepID=UPI00249C78F5|nr:DUF2523 family protein [Stenotrophomonas sp. PS02301]